MFILLAGVAYTVLLFSWQWLLCHQDKKNLQVGQKPKAVSVS